MSSLYRIATVIVGIVLVLHGIAHAPGALGSLKLATFENVSYQPNLLTSAGDGVVMLLGVFWVVAGIAFVFAGASIILRWHRAWFAVVTAVAISLPLTVLWYQDAVVGLVLNAVVLVAIVALKLAGVGQAAREQAANPA
jgi:hypothetical protein